MIILFFGSQGWIGQQFAHYLQANNITYIQSAVRADNQAGVEEEIKLHNPTHIVAFIGRTHGDNINTIDYLEQPGKLVENVRDNLYAPVTLSILCQKYNIHFTYLGTGCIFNSDDPTSTSFTEDD
ncbi:NAD-dependent epimerase/dehydratase family protein, partial [bacterium]|nr:NAD-dependent epimerase/dehydratase family protein [bacterium]